MCQRARRGLPRVRRCRLQELLQTILVIPKVPKTSPIPRAAAPSTIARAIGCSETLSATAARCSSLASVYALRCHEGVSELGLATGNSASLIQEHRSNCLEPLQALTTLDQDALLSALSCAHHDGRRCRQTERTRAGDHQHGDTRDQRHDPRTGVGMLS